MVFVSRGGFFLILCVFFQLTGTIFATVEANADRRQYVYNATDQYNPAVACTDHPQKLDTCALAGKRCHCEENRYEMYTYCKRSCGYCGQERLPQRFWRVVNWAPLNRTWFVSEVQFFKSKHDKNPLPTSNPASAIASSTYLSFPAPHAFDGNRDTAWLPDGWWERIAGGDWIGYDFPTPVDINSVRIISDYNDSSDVSAKILVEAGPSAFGPFQTKWMSVNYERKPDMRFNNPRCPLFWKRFMTDRYAYCYKLVTEYLSWDEARDKCGTYGGDLVSINTHEEQVFVRQELLSCGYTWLGFNDRDKEGTFIWSDGKNSSFFYWDNDIESDDQMSENEDCVAMTQGGQWRTFHCENRFYFFCKKRILTDNDKLVPPNTVHRQSEHVNQTLPDGIPPPETPLPSDIEYPPGITPPPPPPYPYSYPKPNPVPGIIHRIMQHISRVTQQILNPTGWNSGEPTTTKTPGDETPTHGEPAPGDETPTHGGPTPGDKTSTNKGPTPGDETPTHGGPTPSDVGGPASNTPSDVGGPASNTPSDVGGPASNTPSDVGGPASNTPSDVGGPASNTPSDVGGPASATSLVAGTPPAGQAQPAGDTQPATNVQPAVDAKPPAPAPSAPIIAPQPPVVAPALHPKQHKHHAKKLKKKHHHKVFHGTFKYKAGKTKKVKKNHKKIAKVNMKNVKHGKNNDDEVDMDDDFLDMVTRSNIPQPEFSEKPLRSDIENTQEQLKDGTR